ncbi:MAG: Repeat protein [Verrucomicrobiales bacterium]|nr:Repeat protein [Verrucomicrobiales bacterium]
MASSLIALQAASNPTDRSRFTIAKLSVPSGGKAGFTLMDGSQTGVQFTNLLPASRWVTNINLVNGSGVALGDFDEDGLCDIYLCSLAGSNVLYKNLGNWTFKDVTAEAGVGCANQTSTGAVFADLDGDGHLDLLVTSLGGPNACFMNDGKGHFTDRISEAGLVSKWGSTSMALADIDGNGTLDLYVCNYGATSILRSGGTVSYGKNSKGEPVVLGRNSKRLKIINGVLIEAGEPDILYLNDGHAHFTPVQWSDTFMDESGVPVAEAPWDQGLSVIMRDLNNDGFPDIYVCNDMLSPDRIWLNNGKGKFRAAPALTIRKVCYSSMGVDVADIDRDGHDDIFVADMLSRDHQRRMVQQSLVTLQPNSTADIQARFQIGRNVLLCGRGDGTFAEIGNYSGIAASDWTWTCAFMDVDLDGWEDLLVTNGFEYDANNTDVRVQIEGMKNLSVNARRQTMLLFPRLATPNCAFHNLHDRRFEEVGQKWGFDAKDVSHGMALADLDNDGDLDLVVNCMNSGALLYRNETSAPRIAVRLEGGQRNTRGIGARITVSGGPVIQSQVMIAGGRYVSSDDPMRVFAAGSSTNVLSVLVDWPSGIRSEITNLPANSMCVIQEKGTTKRVPLTEHQFLFSADPSGLNYRHEAVEFDDFSRQPSLPRKLSQIGPVIVVKDLDGDGFEDLIIGAGKGGRTAVLMNRNGKFQVAQPKIWEAAASSADTAIAAFRKTDRVTTIIQAQSNYEEVGGRSTIHVIEVENGQWYEVQTLEIPFVMVGSITLGDVDGDGDLDLFLGGRCIPGEYPRAASSFLYRNNGGTFELDRASSDGFRDLGLVTGAIFSDLNGDGYPELIVSLEWGAIRVFSNKKGIFEDATASFNLARDRGLWSFVTTADLDGDGKLDILAGNFGLNSLYHSRMASEVALFHGDFNGDGHESMVEAYRAGQGAFLPFRELTANARSLPWLNTLFSSHASFGATTVEKMIAGRTNAAVLTANCFETSMFLNRGNSFERYALSSAAQYSPAMSGVVADFTGDAREDIFLAQNFFAVRPEDERLDSGRGLFLRGSGAGKFAPNTLTSGIASYGQQGAAVSLDFENNGHTDLVVSQNSGSTDLYRNQGSGERMRLRLLGQVPNRDAIGATVRVRRGVSWGGIQEIHCASGPIGQSSFVQSIPTTPPDSIVRVVWPSGITNDYPLPANAHSIVVEQGAGLTIVK